MDWIIYYGDQSDFTSDAGRPDEAPPVNVQIIAQVSYQEGRVLLSGHDFYWWEPLLLQWSGGDVFGMYDLLMRHPGVIKFARSMRTPDFQKLFERAVADPRLPRKSSTNYPLEERR